MAQEREEWLECCRECQVSSRVIASPLAFFAELRSRPLLGCGLSDMAIATATAPTDTRTERRATIRRIRRTRPSAGRTQANCRPRQPSI